MCICMICCSSRWTAHGGTQSGNNGTEWMPPQMFLKGESIKSFPHPFTHAIMPPTRTKPLPRASAALLPPYVVPEVPGERPDADSLRDMIYENSEGRCIQLNADLCKAHAAAGAL
jgi:hypothetical protein